MADTIKVELPGLKEAAEGLKKYPELLRRMAIGRALVAMGRPMQKQARSNLAAGLHNRTGKLSRSLSIKVLPHGPGSNYVNAGIGQRKVPRTKGPKGKVWHIHLWRFLELGTEKQRKRPFLAPAAASTAQQAVRQFAKLLERESVRVGRAAGAKPR